MSASVILLTLASLASLAAWIWLVTVAFQSGEKNWGIFLVVSVFIPVVGAIVPIVFMIKFWAIARRPAFLMLGSLAVTVVGILMLVSQLKSAAEQFATSPEFQAALRDAQKGGQESAEEASNDSAVAAQPSENPIAKSVAPPPTLPPPPTRIAPPEPPKPTSAPPVTTDYVDPRISPLTLDTLAVGDPNPNQMRTIRFRARNTDPQPIREANLALSYFDARGRKLGQWTTVHTDSTNIVPGSATNEFSLQAFFVPQFTREVRVEVAFLRFGDGSRWPALHPTLNPQDTSAR